jgi:phosphatidylserine/phosphatidylglycerophosphate/cardiolipin synthase-like enzyme
MLGEILAAIQECKKLGIHVFCVGGHIHEKVAIIDRRIYWEGSLNILSQRNSREIMSRFTDAGLAKQVLGHLNIASRLKDGYRQPRPGNPISKAEKIVLDVVVPVINWWLSAIFKVMIMMLRGIMAIFNIVSVILR